MTADPLVCPPEIKGTKYSLTDSIWQINSVFSEQYNTDMTNQVVEPAYQHTIDRYNPINENAAIWDYFYP